MRNCKCHPNRKTSTATTNVYISETIFNKIEIELYPLFILMNLITSSFPHSASSLCLFLSLSSTISLLPTYLPTYSPLTTGLTLHTNLCLPAYQSLFLVNLYLNLIAADPGAGIGLAIWRIQTIDHYCFYFTSHIKQQHFDSKSELQVTEWI